MSLIRHRRRTHLLCKETGKQKWTGMLVETGKAFVDPYAMMTQMREDSDFCSLPPLTILCWRTLLVITKHPEDGHGIAQKDEPQPIHSSEEALPIRSEHCESTKCSRSRHWKWSRRAYDDLPPSPEKNQRAKTHKTQEWPRKAVRSRCVGNLPSYDRWEVCTSHHHGQWRYRPVFNDHRIKSMNAAVIETASEILGKHRQKKKNPGSLQKFLICTTKGENWGRNDLNMKDLRNTRKWTTTSRGAWKRQKKTGWETVLWDWRKSVEE